MYVQTWIIEEHLKTGRQTTQITLSSASSLVELNELIERVSATRVTALHLRQHLRRSVNLAHSKQTG